MQGKLEDPYNYDLLDCVELETLCLHSSEISEIKKDVKEIKKRLDQIDNKFDNRLNNMDKKIDVTLQHIFAYIIRSKFKLVLEPSVVLRYITILQLNPLY